MNFLSAAKDKVVESAVAAKDKVAMTVGAKEKPTPAWAVAPTYKTTPGAFSSENASAVDPACGGVVDDMDQPLNHYFISSSHNTYCESRQLCAPVSLDAYEHCLRMGARSVELDVHDGPNGTPVVFHGTKVASVDVNVMAGGTRKIPAADIFASVARVAFEVSEFPVILCMELHCSAATQDALAKSLVDAFGPKLVQGGLSSRWFDGKPQPPSPRELANRVLVNVGTGLDSDALKALVCLKCYGNDHPVVLRNLSEKERVEGHDRGTLVATHATRFCRVYPGSNRLVSSSNPSPVPPWTAGVQFVALNFQHRTGLPMIVHQGLFRGNGMCGYVLKPEDMRTVGTSESSGTFPALKNKDSPGTALTLTPKAFRSGGIVKPSRPVSIAMRLDSLKEVSSASAIPESQTGEDGVAEWSAGQSATFDVRYPSLAILTFVVSKNGKERWQFSFPARFIVEGKGKVVPLLDFAGGSTPASLVVDVAWNS